MGIIGDIGGSIGDIAGLLSGGQADDDAQNYYHNLIARLNQVNPTVTAEQAAPSDQGAALDAIRELQQTYRSGGLDPIARAGLAEATTGANRSAQASREAVLEGARARGAGRSGVALALQQKGGQDAMGDANLAATRAAAVGEANRRGAIGEAGDLGLRTSAAQDAISRFNASMRQGAQQQTFANKSGQIGQLSDLYGGVYNPALHSEQRTARLYGSIGRFAGGVGDAAMAGATGGFSGFAGGDVPSWLKADPTGGGAYT